MDGIITTTTVKQNRPSVMRGGALVPNNHPIKHRLSSSLLSKIKNATLVSMSSAGPLMAHGFCPKVDQEESIRINHKISIYGPVQPTWMMQQGNLSRIVQESVLLLVRQ
jgi:hypothetical protein